MEYQYTIGSYNLHIIPFLSDTSPEELVGLLRDLVGDRFTLLDGTRPYTMRQLLLAYIMAKRAFARRRNISKSLGIEMLLYLSGTRQIRNAIRTLGYKGRVGILVLWDIDDPKKVLNALSNVIKVEGVFIKSPSIESLLSAGYPENVARRYHKLGADELLMIEVISLLEAEE